jgi:hypothetical protein
MWVLEGAEGALLGALLSVLAEVQLQRMPNCSATLGFDVCYRAIEVSRYGNVYMARVIAEGGPPEERAGDSNWAAQDGWGPAKRRLGWVERVGGGEEGAR